MSQWECGGKWGRQVAGVREHTRRVRGRCDRRRGEVPDAQLIREVGAAHRAWLARRNPSKLLELRGPGMPKCRRAGAAIEEWIALGRPKRGFKALCAKHGANYKTAVVRRARECREQQGRAVA